MQSMSLFLQIQVKSVLSPSCSRVFLFSRISGYFFIIFCYSCLAKIWVGCLGPNWCCDMSEQSNPRMQPPPPTHTHTNTLASTFNLSFSDFSFFLGFSHFVKSVLKFQSFRDSLLIWIYYELVMLWLNSRSNPSWFDFFVNFWSRAPRMTRCRPGWQVSRADPPR
jgi:hypothetical protein